MEPVPVQQSRTPAYPTRREVLTGAATFTLASLAGCWPALAEDQQASAIVAPIFEHGEGRGATGCVVISPPVFLSEEEAMQIIREELGKHGVELKGHVTLKAVRIRQRIRSDENTGKGIDDREDIISEIDDDDLRQELAGSSAVVDKTFRAARLWLA